MPFKTGSWGKQAKKRSKNRTIYFLEYRKKIPLKRKARYLVERAVKKGILNKLPCRDCKIPSGKRIEAHHPNYKKPLKVIWLCSIHHRDEHKRMKN